MLRRLDLFRIGRWRPVPCCAIIAALVTPLAIPVQLRGDDRPSSRGISSLAATGSRAARKEATRSIPWREIPPAYRDAVREVVLHPSIFRRMPTKFLACDPDLHEFLLQNPDVLVHLWQHMGITDLNAQRIGTNAFQVDDGLGTTSQLDLIHSQPRLHVYYGTGQYDGSMLPKKVQGQGVVVVRSEAYHRPDGQVIMRDTMEVFVKLDSMTLSAVAKTVQPLFVKNADFNFVETANFVGRLSRTARENPAGMQRLVHRLSSLDLQTREQFASVLQAAAGPQSPILDYATSPPLTEVSWLR